MADDLQGQIYKKLNWLNELPLEEAIYVFVECSGSETWARQMAASRPFAMLDPLYRRASELWLEDDFGPVELRLNALLER